MPEKFEMIFYIIEEVGLALVVGPAVLREELVPHAVGVGAWGFVVREYGR